MHVALASPGTPAARPATEPITSPGTPASHRHQASRRLLMPQARLGALVVALIKGAKWPRSTFVLGVFEQQSTPTAMETSYTHWRAAASTEHI